MPTSPAHPAARPPPHAPGATLPPLPAVASPPPLPLPVLPVFIPYAIPTRVWRWSAATLLATATGYFAGMSALTVARDRPSGPPSATDLLLACGVFPLALILGFLLFCLCVGVTICTPGRGRLLAALATALTAAAVVLAFRGT